MNDHLTPEDFFEFIGRCEEYVHWVALVLRANRRGCRWAPIMRGASSPAFPRRHGGFGGGSRSAGGPSTGHFITLP